MPSIYKVTNKITNDFYIGKTTQSLNKRWGQHKRNAKLYKKYSINNKFCNAVRKYDASNFIVELIEEVDVSQIDEREIYWIMLLNPKYNTAPGGVSTKGFLGKKLSEQHRNNLLYSKSYSVFQYDLEGNFIKEWVRLQDAINYYNSESIFNAISGRQRTAKNFRWFKEYLGVKIDRYIKINHSSKEVYRIDSSGNRIKYESMVAAKSDGFCNICISLACSGKIETHKGFKWEYVK